MPEEKQEKKYYSYAIQFESKEARDDFKNYLENRKAKGTSFYKTAKEMLELHKEYFKR